MRKLIALSLAASFLMISPASAKPNVRGYVGPGGVYLEFGNPIETRPYRRKKCRTHTHWRGDWSLTHRHCIRRDRSWRWHKRRGHRR
jgi:hypothetical protein